MQLPEYVSKSEVRRICESLGLKDWSEMEEPSISTEEATIILKNVNIEDMPIDVEDFRQGLEVELEHGIRFKDANVTNNHPILTAKIVLAHLKETLDYYNRLNIAELEGDLLKAIQQNNLNKIKDKYSKLVKAQILLSQAINNKLK